ncbi:MAG: hypothetical protein LBC87_12120 [Fibromonadaceae bacterium]|jgi:hypothetical protein|nr:hypothetical protein [Fibromonadaceae bacterium]
MDTSLTIGIIGAIASIISLIIALVQYMRYRDAKNNLRKLKQIRSTQIRGSILLAKEAYDALEYAECLAKDEDVDVDKKIVGQIAGARKSIEAQCLRLLEQAILDEECFTEETAREWLEKGLLQYGWTYQAALKLTQNKVKTNKERF